MKLALVLTVTLLLPLVHGIAIEEDDIVFDDAIEETSSVSPVVHRKEFETPRTRVEAKKHRIERFWGVPDITVTVGHVLKLRIPKQAFAGNVDRYKVRSNNGKPLVQWIHFDEAASTFLGVPTKKDVGQHHINVRAYGKHGDVATDSFSVRVKTEKFDELKHKDGKTHCEEGEEQTLLAIILDVKFEDLKPVAKVEAIENLAGFLGLHTNSFSMHPQNSKKNSGGVPDSSVILTGPGNVKHRKEKHSTSIQWQVGCEGRLWRHQADLLKQLSEQARDGTLAEVLQLPVLLWRVKSDASSLLRSRREIGSGNYADNDDNDEYDNYDDYDESYDDAEREDEEEGESITEMPPRAYVPSASESKDADEEPEHPHRHHHGEEAIGWKPIEDIDEDEIVPMVNQRLGNVFNGTSSRPLNVWPTISSQTSPVSASSTTSSSATTTTTTATSSSSSPTTSPKTGISTSTSIATPSPVSSTTNQVPITIIGNTTTSVPSVVSTTWSPSTFNPATASATTDTTKLNVTTMEVPAVETNFIERESDSDSSTSFPIENTNTPPAPSPLTFTPDAASRAVTTTMTTTTTTTTSSEKMDSTKSTFSAVFVNLTTEESTERTEEPTTSQSTTTSTTTAIPITTVVSTTTTTEVPIVVASTSTSTTTTTSIPIPETTSAAPTTTTQAATTTTTAATTATASTTTTTTTERTRTIAPTITEKIEYGVRNFPPRQDKRLKKIPVTAGKPLSYIIPADTFSDVEDGDTRNLRLSLFLQGTPVKNSHWLQLNSETQEVYGLPLENDVSIWDHDLVASDSEGLNVTERLDIYVQQHKLSRSVNHEFSIYLKIEKRSAFPTNVDWELKVVRSLAQLYGDNDPSQITVRSIDITQDQALFTWTNDSVPRSSECPKNEINKLLHVLIADKDGEPSALLMDALAPEIRVKRVVYQGIGQCEEMKRPELPKAPIQEPKTNFPPVPRNQVDHIYATVGQLLVYKVPHDTFYDPEDGSAYNMRMSLLTNDRTPIPPHDWLQFDNKNREFYGVPLREDIGRKEYQLIVTDKEGASATDGMVVVVEPAPLMRHSVEFSMTLAIPYESFAHSAFQKKTFIEKVRDLFQDKDTSAISLDSITEGSTVVTWRNVTLPTNHCPNSEIARLSEVLVKPDKSLTDRIEKIMGEEFPVKQITLTPMGMCLGQLTGVHSPDSFVPPSKDSTSVGTSSDDYLITFVLPAIIIAAMLILAGIIACVLYRRRRSGKMSVSEQDDERQSFRSKGIPVIFQDELDEKPDPGNKSPVILKEEKPPLPPPEYQKAEDGADVPMLSKENSEEPYQPPPPFATNRDNNRQNRPKPTPTYRKPPPYVPP